MLYKNKSRIIEYKYYCLLIRITPHAILVLPLPLLGPPVNPANFSKTRLKASSLFTIIKTSTDSLQNG